MGLGKHNGGGLDETLFDCIVTSRKKMWRAKPFTDLNSSHSLSRRNFISLTINHAAVLDRLDLHIPREEEAGEEEGWKLGLRGGRSVGGQHRGGCAIA